MEKRPFKLLPAPYIILCISTWLILFIILLYKARWCREVLCFDMLYTSPLSRFDKFMYYYYTFYQRDLCLIIDQYCLRFGLVSYISILCTICLYVLNKYIKHFDRSALWRRITRLPHKRLQIHLCVEMQRINGFTPFMRWKATHKGKIAYMRHNCAFLSQ